MKHFTFIDLFAGIGGFRQALQSLGGQCLGYSEIFKDAIKTYCINYGESECNNFGDITKIKDLPCHDFMTAGVPCQSWSIAGKNLGFDDDRGQLWNDTLYLLNKTRPKAFIFENVKGLADPRNRDALKYILERIAQAGYYARPYVLNSYDYGVPQTRIRIYIVGFKNESFFKRFRIPQPVQYRPCLRDVLDNCESQSPQNTARVRPRWSLSCNANGVNDYFLFNDLRNGDTTIHSWDIIPTTERQKHICYLLLRNRRKKIYGKLDGNPLSLMQFRSIDASISKDELTDLVKLGILKEIKYKYEVVRTDNLTERQQLVVGQSHNGVLNIDELRTNRAIKMKRIPVAAVLAELEANELVRCIEKRYDFKNTKISTGLNGVNRIFLPSSNIYPTLVASDTNDYVTSVNIEASSASELRSKFLTEVFEKNNYRRITRSEACRIQGFPTDFILPEARSRWMHLIGNSVSVPVIRQLAQSVIETGVFEDADSRYKVESVARKQPTLFPLYS